MRSRVLLLTPLLVATVGGLMAFATLAMNTLPVSESRMQQVELGDTPARVISILGNPVERLDGGDQWQYAKPYLWTIVYVHFQNGEVARIEVDR